MLQRKSHNDASLNLSRFKRFSWVKTWFERFDPCKIFDIMKLRLIGPNMRSIYIETKQDKFLGHCRVHPRALYISKAQTQTDIKFDKSTKKNFYWMEAYLELLVLLIHNGHWSRSDMPPIRKFLLQI